jgi:hypothetical protein
LFSNRSPPYQPSDAQLGRKLRKPIELSSACRLLDGDVLFFDAAKRRKASELLW